MDNPVDNFGDKVSALPLPASLEMRGRPHSPSPPSALPLKKTCRDVSRETIGTPDAAHPAKVGVKRDRLKPGMFAKTNAKLAPHLQTTAYSFVGAAEAVHVG